MLPRIKKILPVDRKITSLFSRLKQENFSGDLRDSYADRITYATDNSIYQITPSAVTFPKSKNDLLILCRVLNLSEFSSLAVTGRGGGTGTNGQSLTNGIVVDFSKYMNQILSINYDDGYAVIQPGVVLDALNRELNRNGYFFAPSVSTANRATIGGMIGTDAAGKGSKIYGKTSDHIIDLDCILLDGTEFQSSKQDNWPSVLTDLSNLLEEVAQMKSQLLDEAFPKMNRSVTGYNLPETISDKAKLNLNKLIAGSEGSLCFITEIKVKILPVPPIKKVALMKFPDFTSALRSSEIIAECQPDAIEVIDNKILKLAMEDEVSEKASAFFDEADRQNLQSFNLVEFSAHTHEEMKRKTENFTNLVESHEKELNHIGVKLMEYTESLSLWEMREKGVGLLANLPGERKPIAFVEDCAVPPKNLLPFIVEFKELLDKNGLEHAMYGHVDVGCMHVRPAMNMRDEKDEALIRSISDEVEKLARKYGGVLWGEHGKGYRGEYAPDFFGKEVYGIMQEIKSLFDPNNRMNPGKIALPKNSSNNQLLKIDEVSTRGQFDRQINRLFFDSFGASVNCNGNGLCFHHAPDYVMCPSYKQNHDRIHSPKGRAGIIREWLLRLSQSNPNYNFSSKGNSSGFVSKSFNQLKKLLGEYDFSHEVKDAMAGCLSCKACTTQCPVKVDIPEQKSAFLQQYHQRYFRSTIDYAVKSMESVGSIQLNFPAISNFLSGTQLSKFLIEHVVGLRDVPKFSLPTLKQRVHKIPQITWSAPPKQSMKKGVVLVPDAFNLFYDSSVLEKTAQLLIKLGYHVFIPPFKPNGKTAHVRGFLDSFRNIAKKNLDYLDDLAQSDLPILFVEPSILLTYKQEYKIHLPDKKTPDIYLLQDWIANHANIAKNLKINDQVTQVKTPVLALHCTERTSLLKAGEWWKTIFAKFGISLEVKPLGCCGMAGAFGHEVKHYQASKEIYELSWKSLIENPNHSVLVTGYSCRSQAKRFSSERPLHPAEYLNNILQ